MKEPGKNLQKNKYWAYANFFSDPKVEKAKDPQYLFFSFIRFLMEKPGQLPQIPLESEGVADSADAL